MLLIADHISYVYSAGTAYEKKALNDVSLTINKGEFIGIIGHTGSGKSTLIQHFNGLEKATSGTIYFNGQDIYDKDFNMKSLRSKVGLVFQYPEHQLFETTVLEDVKFGPKNLGLDKLDIPVAIIKNAKSKKMGKKDIIKIEGDVLDLIDFDVIGYIDHNITINVIKNNSIVEKKTVSLPEKITNIIKCKNPRCITSIEQELPHIFYLSDKDNEVYRCIYCEEKRNKKK